MQLPMSKAQAADHTAATKQRRVSEKEGMGADVGDSPGQGGWTQTPSYEGSHLGNKKRQTHEEQNQNKQDRQSPSKQEGNKRQAHIRTESKQKSKSHARDTQVL